MTFSKEIKKKATKTHHYPFASLIAFVCFITDMVLTVTRTSGGGRLEGCHISLMTQEKGIQNGSD
jgi:hypothetical protein